MWVMTEPGRIVVLNGAPRSGKSSIATAVQDSFDEPWMNLGVDMFARSVTPTRYRPGIGLRPGGERPDVEKLVPVFYAAMYESVVAHSRLGLNVVVDVGHHDAYSTPLRVLSRVAEQLDGLPAFLVGVQCPTEVIMERRDAGQPGGEGNYSTSTEGGGVPEAVLRWQREVHIPGIYDLEVDTSVLSPAQSADAIRRRLEDGPPTAFRRIALLGDR
jgi:chloramphenicol 3-O phosphotransferase